MKITRNIFVLTLFAFSLNTVAQITKWREMHKVKKKETIFDIARDYGLTVDQLMKANPEMSQPGYELKKGDFIFIPFADENQAKAATNTNKTASNTNKAATNTTPKTTPTNICPG